MNIFFHFTFLIISLSCPLLDTKVKIAYGNLISPVVNHQRTGTSSIGAIFDGTCTSVKVVHVATEMVIYDFYFTRNRSLLHFQNSLAKPCHAALEAEDLISTYGVKPILGAHKQDDASAIAEAVTDEAHDHVLVFLSFSDSIPTTLNFTWVLRATPRQQVQMNAIAVIVQSWGLHQVTLIYEKAPTLSSPELLMFSQLSHAFQQYGGELSHSSLQTELRQLKKHKHRVLVIFATLGSGYPEYQLAKNLNITGAGYAWIATNSITDLFHSISPKKMSSMQDNIGTKTYFPENWEEFDNFRKKDWSNIRNIHLDEEHDEPGMFASQVYNLVRALLHKPNITNLFQKISAGDPGSELQVINWKKSPAKVVEIVNVTGKAGLLWSYESNYGFLESIDGEGLYLNSIEIPKEVLLPAQPRQNERRRHLVVPVRFRLPIRMRHIEGMQGHTERMRGHTERRRRILTIRSEPIRVGVPAHSMFQQFVKVETDPKTNLTSYDGFSLKVFEEAMKIADVNNDLTFNYYSFDGEYDDLVKQIALGKFDMVAGDVTILEERHKYANFSQAYTESGMVLVVPTRSRLPIQMWLFLNPFTTELWGLILAITVYNGFIVWLIERNRNPEFRSSTVWNQIGTLFWPASTTLFTWSADNLCSNLSRMVMVVWLFVALIITQSYMSILSSMLTAQRLAPATKDVATLKQMNVTVGYCRGSFLKSYMINALGFNPAKIKKYSSTLDYAKALKTGEIAGIFLEVPSAKVFLAQYCKSFMKTEQVFKVGGYGFAFKKDFPLLPDINKAILKISENGKLLELEERYFGSKECAEPVLFPNEDAGIGLDSFAILFVLTGCTSTVALAIYVIKYIICSLFSTPVCSNLFKGMSTFIKKWRNYRSESSAIVIIVENPGNLPEASYSEARQHILQYNY